MKNKNGFTLIELIVTMAVTTLLLGAIYLAVNATQRHTAGIERQLLAQQDVKPALDLMATEIAMASFNPNFTAGHWLMTTSATAANNCNNPSTNQIYRGIQEATTNSISIEMDVNENCTSDNTPACMSGSGNPNEVIRYNYDTANQYITRATNCGSAQPFLGDTVASGRPRSVRVINDTLGLPVFRYFNGAGTEISSTGLPADIPDITRIVIILAVETEHIAPNTGQRRRFIYSTSVIPRNHAITQ